MRGTHTGKSRPSCPPSFTLQLGRLRLGGLCREPRSPGAHRSVPSPQISYVICGARCKIKTWAPCSNTSEAQDGDSEPSNQVQTLLGTGSRGAQASLPHGASPAVCSPEGPRGHILEVAARRPQVCPLSSPVPSDMPLSLPEPQSPLPESGFMMTLVSLLWSLDCMRWQTEISSRLIALCLEGAGPAGSLNSRTMRSHLLSG